MLDPKAKPGSIATPTYSLPAKTFQHARNGAPTGTGFLTRSVRLRRELQVPIDSIWMRRSVISGPRVAASRARAVRSRQCQSKWAGSRVWCTRTALVTAPFPIGHDPAAARSARIALGMQRDLFSSAPYCRPLRARSYLCPRRNICLVSLMEQHFSIRPTRLLGAIL